MVFIRLMVLNENSVIRNKLHLMNLIQERKIILENITDYKILSNSSRIL